ncbi:MAG: hypothetical protein FJW35_06580, partial [Acidobacteria bacterium]|nr:hypothetical protein [Acidobacteriota bacterium]
MVMEPQRQNPDHSPPEAKMNSRERFLRIAHGRPADRVPHFEEELRQDVLDRWYGQGLSRDVTVADCREFFGLDRYEYFYLWLEPQSGALRTPSDFDRIREGYLADRPDFRTPRYWKDKAEGYRDRDFPLGIMGWRGFMLPLFSREQEWDSLQDVLLALYDHPEHMRSALDTVADCFTETVGLALQYLSFDFGVVSEPIASPRGPVISPAMFREFVLPYHRRIVDFFHSHGVDTVIFRSISNVSPLLPAVVESGVDGLWITQTGGIIDYRELRRDYPDLLLVGGIDSRALLSGEAAI